jgi:hypothetical protein
MNAAHLDDSTLNRYRVLVDLAERGEGGEKTNAQKLVEKMRAKHPGIHAEAFRPEEPVVEESPFHSTYRAPNGSNLRDIFGRAWDQVRNGASWAANAAYEAAQMEMAREAAEATVEIRSKVLASGKWQVAAKIELDQLELLTDDLSPIQVGVFADTVADMVRDQVMAVFGFETDE